MKQEFCPLCGNVLQKEDRYCRQCGTMRYSLQETRRLVAEAKKGDQAASTRLYEMTSKKYYAVVWQMMGGRRSSDEALDVLQDSYIKIFQHMDTLREPENFVAWGKQIVIHTALNYLRKDEPVYVDSDAELDLASPEENLSEEMNPEAVYDNKETSRLVREILNELPEVQRICIYLFYMQDYSVHEIAEELNVSENTVKSRLNYGRKKIKERVLDLEKRGTKLYSMMPFIFFLWAYREYLEASETELSVPQTFSEELFSSLKDAGNGAEYKDTNSDTGDDADFNAGDNSLSGADGGSQPAAKNGDAKSGASSGGSAEKSGAEAAVKKAGFDGTQKAVADGAGKALAGSVIKVRIGLLAVGLAAGIGALGYFGGDRLSSKAADTAENTETEETAEPEAQKQAETGTDMAADESETSETAQAETAESDEASSEEKTETVEETKNGETEETVLDAIARMNYQYIGNTSYSVVYQGGSTQTENAGLNQDAPTGVVSYKEDDFDGDGENELLLIMLTPCERRLTKSSYMDSTVAVGICEKENGRWEIKQTVSEYTTTDGYTVSLYSIGEYIPCAVAYSVPGDAGKDIIFTLPVNGSFSADTFKDIAVITYRDGILTANDYEIGWDETETANYMAAAQRVETGDTELLCKVYVPELYDNSGEIIQEVYSQLTMGGGSVSATIQCDDYVGGTAAEAATAQTESAELPESLQNKTSYAEFYEAYIKENNMEDMSSFSGALEIPFTSDYLLAAAQYDLDGDGSEELIIVRTVAAEMSDGWNDSGSTWAEVYKMENGVVESAGKQDIGYSIDFHVALSGLRVYIYTFNQKTYLMFYNNYTGSAGGSGTQCILCSYEGGALNYETDMSGYKGSFYIGNAEIANTRGNDGEDGAYASLQSALDPYGLAVNDLWDWPQPPEDRICILNCDTRTRENAENYDYTLTANGTNDFTGHTADQNFVSEYA